MKKILSAGILFFALAELVYSQGYQFPLKISATKRYMVDQKETPFFYNGDTGWKLFLKLDKKDALDYLVDRKKKKFNVIQTMLTGFKGEQNLDGVAPFADPEDFSTVNAVYYDHVDWVLRQADSLGLLVAIAPLWSGCCGEGYGGKGAVGPSSFLFRNGPAKSRQFGEFVGKRFSKYQNIIWIIGGDIDPYEDKETINALAEGIKMQAPHQLHTFHASSSHSSTDVWENATWLDVVMTYTYFRGFNRAWTQDMPDVYELNYKEYVKTPPKPYFLGESMYENPPDTFGTEIQVRKQAYWSALTGGCGNAYGSPMWDFKADWRKSLSLPGGNSMEHYFTFFNSKPWYKIVPDPEPKIIVEGAGEYASNDYAIAAADETGTFIVAYIPSGRLVKINTAEIRNKKLKASWYDPRTGNSKAIGNYTRGKVLSFKTPDQNDWVLFIDSSK